MPGEGSPVYDTEEGPSFLRTVQRTGLSSLAVTLPKAWTGAFNVRNGSVVRFRDLGAGRLELSPASKTSVEDGRRGLHIDASDCPPQLLSRLLVGAYITGHDHITITSQRELPAELRAEVERIGQRVLGMSMIEDEPNHLEVRVFLDATKHQLSGLLDRVVRMIRLELELCTKALETGDAGPLAKVEQVEEEIDRFYLLMARQILLASNDFHIAREIGVPSHHYQLGYRVVVKMLEVTADLIATVAKDLALEMAGAEEGHDLLHQLSDFDTSLVNTMEAFREFSAPRAHDALVGIEAWTAQQAGVSRSMIGRSRDKVAAARAQRILSSLGTARELLTIINEITINRSVEPETVARSGGRPIVTHSEPGPAARARSPSPSA
ncbi:MAG: AbrB/MazE/SpoVT family DNA-binding domain-containing protein [Thermoplasmata archaeon]